MIRHEDLELMLQALSICLVLTGIHGYLGIHVLERKVIFVDLAMAQIAALGATLAIFLGYDPHSAPLPVYLFSLGFTLAGAAVFSITRMRHEKVPQEAFIGIVYATASAIAILILAKSATGGEELKGMLVGNILLARWPDVIRTGLIYAAIGAFHWVYRERFFRISTDPEGAAAEGINVRLWDFLFYATFGIVITSSVAIAGVLLVFSFLVVPACLGMMFADRRLSRVLTAWGAGTVVSFLGVWFTFTEGTLPAGPVVVAFFALVLIGGAVFRYVRLAERRGAATAKTLAGAAAIVALGFGIWQLRVPETPDPHEHESEFELLMEELRSDDESKQLHAIDHFLAEPDPHAVPELLALLKRTDRDRVIEHLAATLKKTGDAAAAPALLDAAGKADASLRLQIADAVLGLADPKGLGLLLQVVGDDEAPRFPRVKALRLFEKFTGRRTRYSVGGDPAPLEKQRGWWKEHGDHLKWRSATGRFE